MEKVILEDRFTTHQKITFLLYIGAPFIIGIVTMLKTNLTSIGFLVLLLFIAIYTFLVSVAFLKRGFVKIDSQLYRGSFVRGRLFFKTKIDISRSPKVSVLKFKKNQKFSWFSMAKPDLATDFNAFEINILNERHTKREAILSLKNKNNIERTINFLTSNFDLKSEVYSPNFN
ncbi:hypothetical protein [Aquimarina intermedia]|uniref:PH (Pleckstrin Homology) domain-containing protein n=1 Tax=Aquimarina intermedia TaxID=350814 RepID=A0A5S5BT77_9FLAO|nr:hypothetical protein [Aquimarina intermedia]TYP70375.1 hypothetical protein BD809_11339 [Aquimarina intermedia]